MKLVTYIGLVVRRLWAKRGILIGSLLGATLVIALLVVVPLYQDSVKAVDLRFSLQSALADEVDMTAFVQTTSYRAEEAVANRDLIADLHGSIIAEWYPTYVERIQTREFFVIPTGDIIDWVQRGEDWKEEKAAIELANSQLSQTEEPQAVPSPPYPTPPREALQVRMFTSPTLQQHLQILSGAWPEPLLEAPVADSSAPLPIIVGEEVAQLTQLDVGDVFVLKPFSGLAEVFELVEIAAIVAPVDPGEKIWGVDDPMTMVYLPQETFDAWTLPIFIAAVQDPWLRQSRGLTDLTTTQRWIMDFAPEALQFEEVDEVRGAVGAFRAKVSQDSGGVIAANTLLPVLLDEFDVRSVTVGGPILAILALVVGGALYFLIYTSALTLEREGPEIALLKTRGASTWQTTGIHLAQSAVVAAVAAVAAPYVARLLVGVTGRVPPLSDLTGGEPLQVSEVASITPYVVGGAIVTFLSMGLAILPFARRPVLELRSLSARPAGSSVWQRYNLDLFAIALSIVILFQLVQRGFINTTGGEVRLDALAVVFPVLLLFTGALVLLRLLPWLLRVVGWIMTKPRGLAMALPGWHLGRNPVPYGRLALLVWLTTGLGAFALTYAGTLEQSFQDRAAFVAGTDVRIIADEAGYLMVPDGSTGAAVYRTDGAPRQSTRRAEALAVRADEFASVITWRSDFGAETPQEIFAPLRPGGVAPDLGVELPADATKLLIDGVVVPRSWAEQEDLDTSLPDASLRMMMRAFDADGRAWTIQAENDFVDSEWVTVEFDLTDGRNAYLSDPVGPLTVHALWVERSNPGGNTVLNGESMLIRNLRTTGESEVPFDLSELETANGLTLRLDVPATRAVDAYYDELPDGVEEPTTADIQRSPLYADGTATLWVGPGVRTNLNPAVPALRAPLADLYVLVDRELAANAGLEVGERSPFSIGAEIYDGQVVGFIERVPAMNDRRREGRMIVDLDALGGWQNGTPTWSFQTALARVEAPQELWIETDDPDAVVRLINAQFLPGEEADQIVTLKESAGEFSSRPVQVGLVAVLFVGAAVSVALALAGVTGYVLLAVARRAREMGVLRALGFPRRGVAATFTVEQIAVLGLGAVIGTYGGIALMWAMLPFLQLGETATDIEPPILISVNWTVLLAYIGVVSIMLVFSVIWATRKVSARRMSEVLREVER
ncbi:MAG: ABC transporter permease [Acidimicrobiia bacterium]|nr:ABC transporter permease [Acidimicrobiia bacterium]